MPLPLTTAVPCIGAVETARLAVPLAIVSFDVTASVVVAFQGTVAASFVAVARACGASLLPPQAVRAAREAAATAVGIHRVENLIIRAPKRKVAERCCLRSVF